MENRIIKFRAWHHADQKMYDVSVLDKFNDEEHNRVYLKGKEIKFGDRTNYFADGKMVSLMQFTGLIDKNGNEIYEGDAVKLVGGTCDYLSHGIYADQKYKIGDLMLVQLLKSGFTLCGLNMYDCQIPNRVGKVDNYNFWNHARSLEVIGNIYENPELLK